MTDVLKVLKLKKESMSLTKNRLKTLQYWPIEFMNFNQMAESGFYYDGMGEKTDTVHCFSCKISISDWKYGYVPNEQHQKHSPICKHLREVSQDPVYPEYKTIDDRQKTFTDWKYGDKASPENLYNAGFFYLGEGICCCFHCGTRIMVKWNESTDPLEVHKTFSPNCKFFNPDTNQLDEDDSVHIEEPSQSSTVVEQISNLNVEDEKTCEICYVNRKDLALNPCGHIFCSECCSNFPDCPTCRSNIQSTLRVYI